MSICEEKDVTLYQNQISITMEPSIYSFSLYTALPLMLFFGFYFLFAKTPETSNSQLIRLLEPIYLLRVREASD